MSGSPIGQSTEASGTGGKSAIFPDGTSRVVPLIKPGTAFSPRRTQIDLRFGKTMRIGGARRLQIMADVFNLTNSNASVGATSNAGEPPASLITTFGSAWLRPLNVLQARYVKFGAQLNF